MKNIVRIRKLAIGSLLNVSLGVLIASFAAPAFSQEGEQPGNGIHGSFPCGSIPTTIPGIPSGGCQDVVTTDGCTPISPPPTSWHRLCCYSTNAGNCWQIFYRHQCCPSGGGYQWTFAWKKMTALNACNSEGDICVENP